MSETALVPVREMSLQDTLTLGKVLAASKRFDDATNPEQAVVKVLAGREMGFGPIASMTGIYVIQGRVSVSANMMAQAVKRSGRYDYRVVEMTPDVCELAFFQGGQHIGTSVFTKADAIKAGTKNMDKFPRNMLFARAMSNGVRWFCPDVFQTGVYTPEELGAEVDGDGEIINVTPITVTKPEPAEPFDLDNPTFDDWPDLKQKAVDHLGYDHIKHVANTLKQVFNGDSDNLTHADAWAALVDHQRAKAEVGSDAV